MEERGELRVGCLSEGAVREEGWLFSRACCERTRRNGFKLKDGRFRLGKRNKFL